MSKTSSVIERRIRPIYEYLDIGNPKRAAQEADKLLKKSPDLLCVKALKALSLIRLGKTPEAELLVQEITCSETDEEFTLQALTYCFRDLGRPDKITALYEQALKKQPQNEEYLSHVMMAYARNGQFQQQKQYALQLYKLKPGCSLYYFWSVMATVMQCSDNPAGRVTFLALAEKMMQKYFEQNKLSSESEIKLYTVILDMSDKHVALLDFLTRDDVQKISIDQVDLDQKVVELLKKLKSHDKVITKCESMIRENPDDWFAWLNFISSSLQFIQTNPDMKQSVIEQITQLVLSCVEHTKHLHSKQGFVRGPYLARLKVIQMLVEQGFVIRSELGTFDLGEPVTLILEYLRIFGDKPCCFTDLRPYLNLVGSSNVHELKRRILEENGELSLFLNDAVFQPTRNVSNMRKHICSVQLLWSCSCYCNLNLEDKLNFLRELSRHYLEGLAYGANLISTDLQYSDDYLLLAVYCIWEVFMIEENHSLLVDLLAILEYGHSKSQANFKFKLLMAKVYALIGCSEGLQLAVDALQVKYVMRETLWYVVADHFTPCGFYTNLSQWCSASAAFYNQSDKEVSESITQCYKSGTFDRIAEFQAFKHKLRRSLHQRACKVWKRYFDLVTELEEDWKRDTSKDDDPVEWYDFVDSRDFNVFDTICPFDMTIDDFAKAIEERKSLSFDETVQELKFYDTLTRLVCKIMDEPALHSNQQDALSNGESRKDQDECFTDHTISSSLAERCKVMEDLMEQTCSAYRHTVDLNLQYAQDTDMTYTLYGPPQRNLFYMVYTTGSYFDVLKACILAVLRFFKLLQSGSAATTAVDNISLSTFLDATEMQQTFKSMFSNHQFKKDDTFYPYAQMYHISYLIQTNSFLIRILKVVKDVVRSVSATWGKKSKKKRQPVQQKAQETSELCSKEWSNSFMDACKLVIQSIDTTARLVGDLEEIFESDIAQQHLQHSKLDIDCFLKSRKSVLARIRSSYLASTGHFRRIIECQARLAHKLCDTTTTTN